MENQTNLIGKPVSRVDGRAKVTGAALYASDQPVENLAHAFLVLSTIGRGTITELDTGAAEKAPGVLAVISYRNALRLRSHEPKNRPVVDPKQGEPLPPVQDNIVRFNGQPIAVVVAETLSQARYAAKLVQVRYREEKPLIDFTAARAVYPGPPKTDQGTLKPNDYRRGDPERAWNTGDVRIDETYTIPPEHHNPIETHATVAVWDGPKLTLYDKSQWVDNVRTQVALAFDTAKENVRVISPFVGGAFGSALRAWWHVFVAALAAKQVHRPVKLHLTRSQMFIGPGFRPRCEQRLQVAASRDGTLTALRHEGMTETSLYEQYTENLLGSSRMLYTCPSVLTRYRVVPMSVNTPTAMRAPGEISGVYALECALDELALALGIDPVELRLRNYAERDPEKDLPWSSKSLKECYLEGAKRFGWHERNPKPRSLQRGRELIGYGMASAVYPTNRMPASALVRLLADGRAAVRTASSDMGPGTWTSMTQVAAAVLGLPLEQVDFELGDTDMPTAPVHGGSMTMASVGSAVQGAARAALDQIVQLAAGDKNSPLFGAAADQVVAANGRIFLKDNPSRADNYSAILRRLGRPSVEVMHHSKPGDEKKHYSMYAFGANFVEVRVDADLGQVRVARVVGGFAAGRIINPKTSRSQALGGIVGGIGMALMEHTVRDHRNSRVVNANLADYHVPVNADIPVLDPFLIDEHDPYVNPLGVKGLAEIAIVGVAAAIANAVYHATGKRVRDLPITPDKLFE